MALCYNQRTVVVSDVVSQWYHGEKQREVMLHGGDDVSLCQEMLIQASHELTVKHAGLFR